MLFAKKQQELEALVESLHKTCTRYNMKVSAEKTNLMILPVASKWRLTLLHSEWPKLYGVLAILNAIGLR